MSGNFAECITFYEEINRGAQQVHGHFETKPLKVRNDRGRD